MSARALGNALVAELARLSDDELAPLARRLAPLVSSGRPAGAEPSPYLTAEEAADLLRCRRRRVYELVQDGRLTRHGDGRRLLVARAQVLALASGEAPAR